MISLATVVSLVLYLLLAGAIFGLCIFLINYVAAQFPSEPMSLFAKVAKIILVVLAVLVLIGVLLNLAGYPVVRLGP